MLAGSLFLILIGAILVIRGIGVIRAGKAKNLGSDLELVGPSARFMGISYLGLGVLLCLVAILPDPAMIFLAFISTLLLVRWGIPSSARSIYEQQQDQPKRRKKSR